MTAGFGVCRQPFVGALALGLLVCTMSAQGQEIRWQPVASDGDVVCMPGRGCCGDSEIKLERAGVTVTLFLELSAWDTAGGGHPGDTDYYLGAFQGTVDAGTYDGGSPGNPGTIVGLDLNPVGWDTGMGFEGAYQALKACANLPYVGCLGEQDLLTKCYSAADCELGQLCLDRCDFVYYGLDHANTTCTVSTATLAYSWSCASFDCREDPRDGKRFYGGTLILYVPPGAEGTYNVGFIDDYNFTLFNSCPGPLIEDLVVKAGQITIEVGQCCYGIGTPEEDCEDGLTAGECNNLPGPRLPIDPSGVCGVDECCECVTDSDCDDCNACTDGVCSNCICSYAPNYPIATDCCNPATGDVVPIDDGFVCTEDICDPDTGHVARKLRAGAACTAADAAHDGNETSCQYEFRCGYGGLCAGRDISAVACTVMGDCPGAGIACCYSGWCNCEPPTEACCLEDASCLDVCPAACRELHDGTLQGLDTQCLGDGNGNELDDACEADCDGDEIPDVSETDPRDQDCDVDGTCNGEEIDNCAPEESSCDDCNANGIPDACDLTYGTSSDCNLNGIPDECDIADGTSDNCNVNGIPDECEDGKCCFDLDANGVYEACAVATGLLCAPSGGVFGGACSFCPRQNTAIIPEPGGGVFIHVIGPPVDCIKETLPRRGTCPPGGPYIDPWKSEADVQMCHNFGVAGSPPIPADFFGPGSDPFDGSVCLQGVPLGPTQWGDFDDADTLIERSADPFDRCDLPSGTPVTVDIEVVALSLVDVAPITVTYNGGQSPEAWNVAVDLSEVAAPVGTLTATKTHCNGGTYTSVLNVLPRFTFTQLSDPGEVRMLDTGLEGIDPVTLDQQDPAPWVSDIDPNLGLTADLCSDFHAGIEDVVQETDCDCNGNTKRDKCDIEEGASQDCNTNAVPDECEIDQSSTVPGAQFYCDPLDPPGHLEVCDPDCNTNGIPDDCELAGNDCNGNAIPDECELAGGTSQDCNANTVPDACDIAAGTSDDCQRNTVPDECDIANGTSRDLDGNGIPDECEVRTGACCLRDGLCVDSMAESDCVDVGTYQGDGIACATLPDSDGDGVVDCVDQCQGIDDGIYAPGCEGAIPTLSHWGLIVLTMLLLAGGKIYFGRRRAVRV